MRRSLLAILALAMSWVVAAGGQAAESKPLVVVSFAGYDGTMKSITDLGTIVGNPGLAPMLEAMMTMATGGQGLNGLDKGKPWGGVLVASGDTPTFYAFLPSKEPEKLLEPLKPQLGEIEKTGDGQWSIKGPGRSVSLKQKGEWTFVSSEAEALGTIPDDPVALLGDLPKQYTLAVRAQLANLPASLRDQALTMLQAGMQQGLQQQPGEDDAQYTLRKQMTERGMKQMVEGFNDLDELTLGVAISPSTKQAQLDFTVTAKPNTKMARQIAAASAEVKTRFSGFKFPSAALQVNFAQKTDGTNADEAVQTLETFRSKLDQQLGEQSLSDEQKTQLKAIAKDVFDVLEKTIRQGVTDGAFSLQAEPAALTAVAALQVAEGEKLNKAFKQVVDLAGKEEPAVAQLVKLDAETVAGVHFHVVSVPIPPAAENREKLVKLVGETVDVALGFGPDAAYLGVGRNALAGVKSAIEKSKSQGPQAALPMQLSFALGPIAKLIAEAGEPEAQPIGKTIAGILSQAPGKDHVNLTSTPIERGVRVRLDLEEGVLKVLSALPMIMMGGAGGPPGGPGGGGNGF